MLEGKNAIITGCLQGIGLSTLDVFAENGCNVFACALKATDEFEEHIEHLRNKYGVKIMPIYFDMADNESVKNAAKVIQREKKAIDILVNIAGITKDANFLMVKMDDMQDLFQVDFFSQVLFSQYIVRLMQRTGRGGTIINTSSISGLDGRAGQLAYSSAKSAVATATKTMAAEFGSQGIRVNAIAPGMIDTDMYKDVPKEILEKKVEKTKLKRMGRPEEVANVILFLASDLSSHISGQVIRIDGGYGA